MSNDIGKGGLAELKSAAGLELKATWPFTPPQIRLPMQNALAYARAGQQDEANHWFNLALVAEEKREEKIDDLLQRAITAEEEGDEKKAEWFWDRALAIV